MHLYEVGSSCFIWIQRVLLFRQMLGIVMLPLLLFTLQSPRMAEFIWQSLWGVRPQWNFFSSLTVYNLASWVTSFWSVIQLLCKGFSRQRERVQCIEICEILLWKVLGHFLNEHFRIILDGHCFLCAEEATVWFSHNSWENAFCNGIGQVFHRGLKRHLSFNCLQFY